MATIKDIAKKLNISVSTVSYALNGGPRSVPERVKAAVWETARELDYRPNRVAKQLVSGKSDAIGVVPDRPHDNTLLGPYLQRVFNGVLNTAEKHGQDVLFLTSHSGADANLYLNTLLDGRVDGVILVAAHSENGLIALLQDRNFPHVLVNAAPRDGSVCFGVDNAAGIRMACHHLAQLGHKRVGIVQGLADQPDAIERFEAAIAESSRLGMSIRPEWCVHGDFTLAGGYEATRKILRSSELPTALLAMNDESAVGAIKALEDAGLSVPADMSVIGFDDVELFAFSRPQLTTVRQPTVEISTVAAEALLDLVAGKPVQSRMFAPELIVRDSTASPKEDS